MKTQLNQNLKNITIYASIFMAYALINLCIFINYKSQIVDEHIQFLNGQLPILHSENLYLLKEIKINSKYRNSIKEELKAFEPILTFLGDETNDISGEQLKIINVFLIEELKTPDFLLNQDFEHLTTSSKEKFKVYQIKRFQNKLIKYIYQSKIGYAPSMLFSTNWSLVDFWSKDNYYIYLSYRPLDTFESSMTINGEERNENAILFGPKRTGLHTFDISLSQFDEVGMERKLNFRKVIEVLP